MAKPSPIAAARAVLHGKIAEDFRTRHPQRAAEERALRLQRAAVLAQGKAEYLGTPETRWHAARQHQGALARLYERGHISLEQLSWSQSIRVVHERLGRDVAVATQSLETRVDVSRAFDGTFFEKLGAVRAEVAYTRWRAQVKGGSVALAVIVEDRALSAVARAAGMRDVTARKLLGEALDLWGEIIGQVCREVDEAALIAAQAGIL